MLSRILGYAVTLLMLALLVEGLLRLTPFAPTEPVVEFHDELGWAKRKGTEIERETSEFDVAYAINSLGLRGPETPYEKPAGTKRVLFVGDSFVQGYTVEDGELFLRVFERDLKNAGHPVEALNGGTEGYSTDQEYVWLMSEGLKFRPDYVVLCMYQNDVFQNTQDHYTDRAKPKFDVNGSELERVTGKLPRPPEKSWWARHTTVGNFLDTIRKGRLIPVTTIGDRPTPVEETVVLKNEPAQIRAAWNVTEKLLAAFAATVRDAGAVPVALLIPNRWEIHGDEPHQTLAHVDPGQIDYTKPRLKFADLAKKAGFEVVDPTAKLKEAAANGERLYFHKDWHWNPDGNDLVATVLVDRFTQPDMLGPGTGVAAHTHVAHAEQKAGLPTWVFVVGGLWVLLSILFWRSYPEENVALAFIKVGLLIVFVVGVVLGVGALARLMPMSVGKWVFPLIAIFLVGFILVKIAKRLGAIRELYGTFLRRGHWYMLPLLVVMMSIGMLLVVAASSPFVAPFIYTLF